MSLKQRVGIASKALFSRASIVDYESGEPFYHIQGTGSSIEWDRQKKENYLKDFLEIPELNAVIMWKVRAFSNMKLEVVSRATGEAPNNQPTLVRALRSPNYFQSQREFVQQTKGFTEIFGEEYVYFLTPVGMPNNIKGIYSISPFMAGVEMKSDSPYFLNTAMPKEDRYYYEWDNQRQYFKPGEILHINKTKLNVSQKDYLNGMSTQGGLQAPLRNIRAAYEARNVLIENRGALGILSNAAMEGTGATLPMLPKEKKALQDDFKKYGLRKDKWQIILTNLSLRWQQMSLDVDKLKLFEETREDFLKICDSYGVNYELFGSVKGVTFANKLQAEKNTYQDTIIPEAQQWIDGWNRYFETAGKPWEFRATFTHLPILQEDLKERATTISLLTNSLSKAYTDGAITLAEYQSELKKMKVGV